MLDEMFQPKRFKICHIYIPKYTKTPSYFFHFSFRATHECPGLCQHSLIDQEKNKVVRNEKWKKQLWVFV